ncbi:hypothetical protein PHMEG_0002345 [Phytophthora megakarya]|uniref:Uncharacterized protein n=1 Tax=Phytophthora megakarya TaxID=4795 RepID=A0A225WYY6_9STRA|nr:hypothetical protein PHMEG_0002345 [Phytophthora megakarya]
MVPAPKVNTEPRFNFGPGSPSEQPLNQASSRPLGSYSASTYTGSQAYASSGREPHPHGPGPVPGPFPALPWSAPDDPSGASTAGGSRLSSITPTWDSSFGSTDRPSSRPADSDPGALAFGAPAARGYAPGYSVSFRPFIAYNAVESGGWREQELCTRLYSRLSYNPGTKAWVQQLPETSPVERYLRLKQESQETPRTFLWRHNAAATKTNVDYHSASGCRRHVNQFLKNLRDRELRLSLRG